MNTITKVQNSTIYIKYLQKESQTNTKQSRTKTIQSIIKNNAGYKKRSPLSLDDSIAYNL